ncbi:MAG: type II toxin-antitoxin system PemK/MazF family toxin [Terracidiphilus sp.]|nr:type II toxin-antitoxin system PemK/MazF family toxin [Terracidiphilus sp.]
MITRPVRGQILEVDLDPVVGHEQGRLRPCVVVQNDVSNRFASTSIVVPLTDARNIPDPSPIYVLALKGDGSLKKDSLILCDQIRTVDRQRFGRFFGTLSPETMQKVDWALMVSLGLARGRKP